MAYGVKQPWNPAELFLLDFRAWEQPSLAQCSIFCTCGHPLWPLQLRLCPPSHSWFYPISVPFSPSCGVSLGIKFSTSGRSPAMQLSSHHQTRGLHRSFLDRLTSVADFCHDCLIGSLSHSPNSFNGMWSVYNLCVLSRACFLVFCNPDRLRSFQVIRSWGFLLICLV